MTHTSPFAIPQNAPLIHQHVAVSTSTNSELLHALASGTVSKTTPYMLTASMQTAGRGQHARTWQSPPGNIYLSLYHPLNTSLSGLLSLVVGYHLTQLPIIQNLNRQRKPLGLPLIGVKWANDIGFYHPTKQPWQSKHNDRQGNTIKAEATGVKSINKHLIDDNTDKINQTKSFFKLAGILIEPVFTNNQIIGVVVGVGINIEDAPLLCGTNKEGMDYHAISLNQIIKQTQTSKHPQRNRLYQDKQFLNQKNTKNNDQNHTNNGIETLTMRLPRAEDLYLSVSAVILRAIDQFMSFTHDPYALPQFLTDYASVNVLMDRDIYVTQTSSVQTSQNSASKQQTNNQRIDKIIQGIVVGINADGSLKLCTTGIDQAKRTLDIYTGTIRLV